MSQFLVLLTAVALTHGLDTSFHPHTFVKSARDAPAELDFQMPASLVTRDPYSLLDEATQMSSVIDGLMSQISSYIVHFNVTSGPEAVALRNYGHSYLLAQAQFAIIETRLENANERLGNITNVLGGIQERLQCYAGSDCHPTPITTTLPPQPPYNCNNTSDQQTAFAAGQTGQFKFDNWRDFAPNCTMLLKAKNQAGLVFNLNVSNFEAYNDAKLTIIPYGSGTVYNVNGSLQINNVKTQVIDIVASGTLKFTIDYVAQATCRGYDCAHGSCYASTDNNPTCKCDGCYQADAEGRCTINLPDPCTPTNSCNYSVNGTCVKTPNCDWYCSCPGVDPHCTTLRFCQEGVQCPAPQKSFIGSLLDRFS